MNNDYAKRIAEAVREAAAKLVDVGPNSVGEFYAGQIRSLDLDAIIASVPGPKHVAYAVVAPKGGIHKLAIQRDSAERKAEKWKEEWPDNQCAVAPLCFAPTEGKP
jgi:hypothetical protein